jgi:hypothetical protein
MIVLPHDALFHLFILDASGRRLLAEDIQSRLLLPVVCRPRQSRIPTVVQAYLRGQGLRAIVGGVIKVEDSSEPSGNNVALWLASQGRSECFSPKVNWIRIEDCTETRVLLPFQRKILRDRPSCWELLREARVIDSIGEWVRSAAASHGRRITGEFTQLRVGRQRMLSCFLTADSNPIYCVSGSAVAGEVDLARWLTLYQPDCFPETLAYDSTMSLWLVDSVLGAALTECLTLEHCKRAISKLAELQIGLVGCRQPTITEPVRDFRLCAMISSIDRDFDLLLEVLGAGREELGSGRKFAVSTLSAVLEDAVILGIPDTFVHADAAPPNIFLHEEQIRIIDLETAGWGFPFVAAESLLRSEEILQRRYWVDDLRYEYSRLWLTLLSEYQLREGMRLTPVIMVWARLRRLLDRSFESEPERYWHPAFYKYLVAGYARKVVRMLTSLAGRGEANVHL